MINSKNFFISVFFLCGINPGISAMDKFQLPHEINDPFYTLYQLKRGNDLKKIETKKVVKKKDLRSKKMEKEFAEIEKIAKELKKSIYEMIKENSPTT